LFRLLSNLRHTVFQLTLRRVCFDELIPSNGCFSKLVENLSQDQAGDWKTKPRRKSSFLRFVWMRQQEYRHRRGVIACATVCVATFPKILLEPHT
jgi:hypothetical protein